MKYYELYEVLDGGIDLRCREAVGMPKIVLARGTREVAIIGTNNRAIADWVLEFVSGVLNPELYDIFKEYDIFKAYDIFKVYGMQLYSAAAIQSDMADNGWGYEPEEEEGPDAIDRACDAYHAWKDDSMLR